MKIDFLKESKYKDVVMVLARNLIVIFLLGIALFLVSRNMEKRVDEIAQVKQIIADNVHQLEIYSLLVSQKKTFSRQMDIVNHLLPQEEKFLSLRNDLIAEANRLGLLLNINFGDKEVVDNLSAIKVNLNLNAQSLSQIYYFLNNLQALPFYLSIDSFNIDRANFLGSGKIFIR